MNLSSVVACLARVVLFCACVTSHSSLRFRAPFTTPRQHASAAASLGLLGGSTRMQRVADRNNPWSAQQIAELVRAKLTRKRYRLPYKWSRDGRSAKAATRRERCDNQ